GIDPPMRTLRRRPIGWTAAALVGIAAWAKDSRAGEPVRVAYHEERGCPNQAQFLAILRGRTANFRPAAGGEAARRFDVSVTSSAGASRGVVRITGIDGAESVREVTGPTCAGVVSALALIVALAVDLPEEPVDAPPTLDPPPAP